MTTLTVLVNSVAGLKADQTTTALIDAARALSPTRLAEVTDLELAADNRVGANMRAIPAAGPWFDGRLALPRAHTAFGAGEVLLMRTNPARDQARGFAHRNALAFAQLASTQGVCVLSDPLGLMGAQNKLYLSVVPAHLRPRTLVSRDVEAIMGFAAAEPGPCVLKPLEGTHGRDVFIVHPGDKNMRQIVDVLTREGWCIAQEYLPEAKAGDTRVLVLEGELLEIDGYVAAVRRVPGGDDFRSNISAGGRVEEAHMTDGMRAAVHAIGPRLKADGVFLAGLDFVGEKLVEINVFSPGGLPDIEQLSGGLPFIRRVLDAALERVSPR